MKTIPHELESLGDSATPSSASIEGGVRVKPFLYWLDPLCLASWVAYALNRFLFVPKFGAELPFLQEHLNDSLLIPAALPVLLGVRRFLKLRTHDAPPYGREVAFWLVLWSLI